MRYPHRASPRTLGYPTVDLSRSLDRVDGQAGRIISDLGQPAPPAEAPLDILYLGRVIPVQYLEVDPDLPQHAFDMIVGTD